MRRIALWKYDRAVELIHETDRPYTQIARKLDLSERTIRGIASGEVSRPSHLPKGSPDPSRPSTVAEYRCQTCGKTVNLVPCMICEANARIRRIAEGLDPPPTP